LSSQGNLGRGDDTVTTISNSGLTSRVIASPSGRLPSSTWWIGLAGCGLVVAAGAVAGTGHGVSLVGALLGAAAIVGSILVYKRDPVRGLMLLWLIVVLNAPLSTLAGFESSLGQKIRQADELFVLILVGLTILRTLQTDVRIPWWCVLPPIWIALCGLLSALLHQVPISIAVVGLWLGLKLWIMIVVAMLLPWRPGDLERVYKLIATVGVLVGLLGLADFFTGNAATAALHLGLDYEANSTRSSAVHSIFSVPNAYSLFMSILFAISFTRFAVEHRRNDLALAALFAVSVLLSLRLKGFLSLAVVVMVVAFVRAFAQDTEHRRRAVVVAVVGSCMLVGGYIFEANVISHQVSRYTSTSSTARAKLYLTSEKIAADEFPLGVGFGRFASYPSRTNYSPVYDDYYLSSTYGLSRTQPEFIDDVSWPSVLAETGYAGLIAYVLGILTLVWLLIRRLRDPFPDAKWAPLAALCILAVILVDSIGDPALFDWVPAISFALILGPALALRQREPPPMNDS
jgi:hypothetical protein